MNIQRKNSAHHFRMQSEREQTLISVFFSRTPYLLLIDGRYRWAGKIKMASASTITFTLVHTEKLKPMIKGTISRRMLSSGISHVAFASVYLEKTRMKKC